VPSTSTVASHSVSPNPLRSTPSLDPLVKANADRGAASTNSAPAALSPTQLNPDTPRPPLVGPSEPSQPGLAPITHQGPTAEPNGEGAFHDAEGEELGLTIDVSADVRPSSITHSFLWKGDKDELLGLHVQSFSCNRIHHDDVVSIYTATLNFLSLRRRETGRLSITCKTPLPPAAQLEVKRTLSLHEWLAKDPSRFPVFTLYILVSNDN
jgi:hypothetical protein